MRGFEGGGEGLEVGRVERGGEGGGGWKGDEGGLVRSWNEFE